LFKSLIENFDSKVGNLLLAHVLWPVLGFKVFKLVPVQNKCTVMSISLCVLVTYPNPSITSQPVK